MFLIGFFEWLAQIGSIPGGEAYFTQWVAAMLGLGLVDIAGSLAAIRRQTTTPLTESQN
jgi:hypothetical protein